MSDGNSGHLALIAQWVRGEVVNNTVDIKVREGPFHGRTHIAQMDERHQPPRRPRAHGSRKHPPVDI